MNRLFSRSIIPRKSISRPFTLSSSFPSKSIPTATIHLRSYSATVEKRINALDVSDETPIDVKQIMTDLEDLQSLELFKGTVPKSGNGFKDAARRLYPLFHDEKAVTFGQLREVLPSIFSTTWTIIGERLLNGRVEKLSNLSKQDLASLKFLQIHAVGPKYVEKFIAAGAQTIADLSSNPLIKLTNAQKIGIKHYDDIKLLIPRQEMESLKENLEKGARLADDQFESEILGSYRRGVAFSSDIDLLVRHKSFQDGEDLVLGKQLMTKLLDSLKSLGLIVDENKLTSGPKKYSGLIRLEGHDHYRRIDIRLAPFNSFYYSLLGGSGDALLMKLLRHRAKKMGYTLNEYGMGLSFQKYDNNPNGFLENSALVFDSEKAIFEFLKLPYLEPTRRDYSIWRNIYLAAGINLDYVEKL